MRGIILAAGRGSRMGTLTDRRPKCLTPLAGKPLLQWQLDALRESGIGEVAVVRGYMADKLESPDYAVFDNVRWAETNMVMSLACAEPWLSSVPCVVSYSDIVYHPDVVRALATARGDLAISYDRLWHRLWSERFDEPLSDAETFRVGQDGTLEEIGDRPRTLDEVQGQYMGLLKLTPTGWGQVRALLGRTPLAEGDALDVTALLRRLLAEGKEIATVPVDGRWCEVDSESDLRMYESKLESPDGWSHDWRF